MGTRSPLVFVAILVVLFTGFASRADAQQTVLTGTVVDRLSGAPVSGARVTILGSTASTVTDALGAFALNGLQVATTTGTLLFQATGYFSVTASFNITSVPTSVAPVSLLPGSPIVQGTVRDATTNGAVPGASVLFAGGGLVPGPTTIGTTSDAGGSYSFDTSNFMEAAASALFGSVTATGTGYLAPGFSPVSGPPFPVLKDIMMIPGGGTVLTGTVTDQASNLPIAGATVSLLGSGAHATTDADGVYTFTGAQIGGTSGTLLIQAGSYFSSTQQFTIQLPVPVVRNASLRPGGLLLRGTVRDAITGNPVAGASVLYQGGGLVPGPTTISASTDSAGFYSFDSSRFMESAATGFSGSVTASAVGFLTPPFSGGAFAPPFPGVTDMNLIPSAGTVLTGIVTSLTTGHPIAGATVRLLNNGVQVATNADGVYAFSGAQVGSTTGSLLFQAGGHFSVTSFFNLATPLPRTVDAALQPGGTVLQGTVRNSVTNAVVADATVLYQGGGLVPGPTTIATTTDAAGFYSFDSSQFIDQASTGFFGALRPQRQFYLMPPYSSVNAASPFPAVTDLQLIPFEGDMDGDGILDTADNCPSIDNPTQVDSNSNGVGNACEPNAPPTAHAGANQTIEATSAAGATVVLDGSQSSDPDAGQTLMFAWSGAFGQATGAAPAVTLPIGTWPISLVVDDGNGGTATATLTVTVRDTTGPVVIVPAPLSVEAVHAAGAAVSFAASASDVVDGPVAVACTPASGSTFPAGETTVSCRAIDRHQNTGSNLFTVTVGDSTAPTITSATPSTAVLWPPNHQMVPIQVAVSAADSVDATPACRISSVASNEAIEGRSDGHTAPDWTAPVGLDVSLRAERGGKGSGRVYTIGIACYDAAGNSSATNVQVVVPDDRRP